MPTQLMGNKYSFIELQVSLLHPYVANWRCKQQEEAHDLNVQEAEETLHTVWECVQYI